MNIPQITPDEAYRRITGELKENYIDVRSIPEFAQAHPEGAVNIPILHFDPAQGGMIPNPDFQKVVEANFPKDARLVMGCQVGMRSQKAAEILVQAGYENVANVHGGFGGMKDQSGQSIATGWTELGLPVSADNGDGVSYASLAARVQG